MPCRKTITKLMSDKYDVLKIKVMSDIDDSHASLIACLMWFLQLYPKCQILKKSSTKVKRIVMVTRKSVPASDELLRLQKRDGKTDGTALKFIQKR
ncbi:hypothetical protein KQX54_016394 [Cotesia glomerata]|uniref:Uncharacterized protein n=1 Tax=Cotesia glomerata TaxID=32391 RepID=A0AAV7IRK5_COTGL|nr:hypothetical protein KQX54_016394 [Cotesia glomerata]